MKRTLNNAVITLFLLLGSGTTLFKLLEGWDWIDAFYFTGSTMLTIGYGDLVPTTPAAKVLTVIYAIMAVGTALYSLNIISHHQFQRHRERAALTKKDAITALKTLTHTEERKLEKKEEKLDKKEEKLEKTKKKFEKKEEKFEDVEKRLKAELKEVRKKIRLRKKKK